MRGFFALLLVVFVVVLGLGLYLDWFSFSVNRNAEGKGTGVSFNVNRQKVAHDTEKAGAEIRRFGKNVQNQARQEAGRESAALQEVRGTVKNVDPAGHRLTLSTAEGRTLTVQTGAETRIRRNEVNVRINELMEGDHVVVQYRVENGDNVARSVTVEPGR